MQVKKIESLGNEGDVAAGNAHSYCVQPSGFTYRSYPTRRGKGTPLAQIHPGRATGNRRAADLALSCGHLLAAGCGCKRSVP